MTKRAKRVWLTPALILVVILIPLVFAVLLYFHPAWFSLGHTNHGQLVTPPVKISDAGLSLPPRTAPVAATNGTAVPHKASALPAGYFSGHWTLVYLGAGGCHAECKAAMYAMRQARLATGEHMRKVQRLYVVSAAEMPGSDFRSNWPGVTVATASGKVGTAFLRQFTKVRPAGGIYIVDPNGRLMMTFSKRANPDGLVKDLRHLLEVNS